MKYDRHIFLTGEIQAGKSTVIKKTLRLLNISYGGFMTYFGEDRSNPDRLLYMNYASSPRSYEPELVVARFTYGRASEALTSRFNELGTEYLSRARKSARLIIMDECGSLERDALDFQREIFSILDGDIPVLGVVKKSAHGWTDKIRNHPRVELLSVNETNRDHLPEKLFELMRR